MRFNGTINVKNLIKLIYKNLSNLFISSNAGPYFILNYSLKPLRPLRML